MKSILLKVVMAGFLLTVFLPMRVSAEKDDGFRLDEKGTVTIVSQHAAKEQISSLCFSMQVDRADADRVECLEFYFEESPAKVLECRYDKAGGELKIYVAGTEALFGQGSDSLTLGKIAALDGNGNSVDALVSVVEGSLRYVYGTVSKKEDENNVDWPEPVRLAGGAAQATPSPTPGSSPTPSPSPAPGGSPTPSPSPAPGSSQTPSPSPAPGSSQTPSPSPAPGSSQTPSPSPAPGNSQTPAVNRTPKPSQTQSANRTPKPSQTPSPSPTGSPDVDTSPEPSQSPDIRPSESSRETDPLQVDLSQRENGTGQGTNVVFAIAIGAIVLFAVVLVMAIETLRKKSDISRRGDSNRKRR